MILTPASNALAITGKGTADDDMGAVDSWTNDEQHSGLPNDVLKVLVSLSKYLE